MSKCIQPLIAIVSAALGLASVAQAETEAERRVRLFEETRIVAVMDLTSPASEYKDDGDPNTLEIVFLKQKKDGPSRVSENGEVIFLYKASDKAQQKLIAQAFEIRLARSASGT
jgi:hypothetical protein